MLKIGKPRSTKGLAVFVAKIAENKLAENVILLNLSNIETAPADFFVVCSCDSDVQAKALADEILDKCRELSIEKPRTEGLDTMKWILLDFFDVVLHIMLKEKRNFYQIEKFWGDGKFYILNDKGKPKSVNANFLNELYNLEENIENDF